jgi:hypothetical protein
LIHQGGLETLRIVADMGAARRSSPVPLNTWASAFAHQFHHPEIIVEDSASVEYLGNYVSIPE